MCCLVWMLTFGQEWAIFQLFKSANFLLSCCIFLIWIHREWSNHAVICVPDLSACSTLLMSQGATEVSRRLLWKMEQHKLFRHHTYVTRRLESEGGVLWRKHSCSGHLYGNLHWNHATVREGGNNFLLRCAERKD